MRRERKAISRVGTQERQTDKENRQERDKKGKRGRENPVTEGHLQGVCVPHSSVGRHPAAGNDVTALVGRWASHHGGN